MIGRAIAKAQGTLARLRMARAAAAGAEMAKGICNQYGCWGDPAEQPASTRPDGKPFYKPPPEPGAADHPWQREAPPVQAADYQEGTRTDPKMWEQDEPGGRYFYSGGDEPAYTAHEWPTPKTDPELDRLVPGVSRLNGEAVGGQQELTALRAVDDTAKEYPVAHWALEAHPLTDLRIGPFPTELARVGGAYDLDQKSLSLNSSPIRAVSAGPPFKMGESWTVGSGARTADEAMRGVFLHEQGHHITTAPGVAAIAKEGWDTRARSLQDAAVSQYAKSDADEYFAESWAAYNVDREGLRDFDPNAHTMVERSLAVLERMSP